MDLSRLRPAKGAVKNGKRVGRGQGSTRGGTSTRGHNGAKSRSGYSRKQGFEGGQMPLQRRVPKFGFKNPFRVAYAPFNLDRIEEIAKANKLKSIDKDALLKLKLIHKNDLIKVLGNGKIESAIELTVHAYSASAKESIEKAGGSVKLYE